MDGGRPPEGTLDGAVACIGDRRWAVVSGAAAAGPAQLRRTTFGAGESAPSVFWGRPAPQRGDGADRLRGEPARSCRVAGNSAASHSPPLPCSLHQQSRHSFSLGLNFVTLHYLNLFRAESAFKTTLSMLGSSLVFITHSLANS